jgi:hypothetical protein
MKTTATNRKVRELLTQLREGRLEPRPEFQRRLVWSNKDKLAFLDTVLNNYPFPEIYVAAGDVNVETGEGKELLVDGQQRITTLAEYFGGASSLKLSSSVPPYADLSKDQKEGFLQYDVVVRDIGKVPIEDIKEVFRRINATRYALNAMEVHNARYEGAFKSFAEALAIDRFFQDHFVFSSTEIKRMQDTRFVLTLASTIMSSYFNRDDALEEFLSQYNDEFDYGPRLADEIRRVFAFVVALKLPPESRAWKTADLFTLLVELHRSLIQEGVPLDPATVRESLSRFYDDVDRGSESADDLVRRYYKAAIQATNDRGSRIARGEAIRGVLGSGQQLLIPDSGKT